MKKLRVFVTVALMLLSLFFLASCSSEVTAYSPDSRVSIVYSELDSTSADKVAYNEIVSAIKEYIGTNCCSITDDLRQSSFEIVVGESNREVTRLAKEYLIANTLVDGDTESYLFYCKDNSIAIVASSEFAMQLATEMFIERYVTSDTLIVKNDMIEFKQFSKTAYLAELDERITAEEQEAWEHRWDVLRSIVGREGAEAVERLYNFWGTEWLEWATGLYDPEYGGFYYSASAHDYAGFYPDIESTSQVLSLLNEFGLCDWYDGYWAEALPLEFRTALGAFVQNMQSESDGYFYHPQWGEKIGVAARGRHLDAAIGILDVAGVTPRYPTPLERANGTASILSEVISAFMDTDEHKSSVVFTASTFPDYMHSESAIVDYLDAQWYAHYDVNGMPNSYDFSGLLSSQRTQIKAAGLIDVVCDWFDAHQDTATGCWEPITDEYPDSGYRAISGLIKIATLYGEAGRAFNHADKMVDTAIEIILDDRAPAHVCYIYNPIGAFSSILGSMRKVGIDTAEAKQKFYSKLPEIIETTIEKQQVFRKELGSFSYTPERSDPASQGLRLSLGLAEGDVNATAVSMHYVADALFDIFGIGIIPMFRYSDYKWFCNQISDSASPVKSELLLETIDFEDGELSDRIAYSELSDLKLEVTDDGREGDEEGKALKIHAGGSASAVFNINMDTTIVPTCTVIEMDMNFVYSANTGYLYEMYIMNSNKNNRVGYYIQFKLLENGTIEVHEMIYPSENLYSSTVFTLPRGEWFKLRIEYYPISTSEMRVKVYVDGECVYIGDTPHNNHYDQDVHNGMNRIYFNCFGGNESIVMLDNIYVYHDASKTFDDSDYNK